MIHSKTSQPNSCDLPESPRFSPVTALRLGGDKNRLDRESGPPAYSLLRLGLIHRQSTTVSRKCNNSATHQVLELQLFKHIKHINECAANCFPGKLLWLGPRNERVPVEISLTKPVLAGVASPIGLVALRNFLGIA